MCAATQSEPLLMAYVRAMRPDHWTKNAIVLAAFFFAFWDTERRFPVTLSDLGVVIPAALLFCLVSSGIYMFNDIRDVELDRQHPVKRFRPVASGAVPLAGAWTMAVVLLVVGVLASLFLSRRFGAVVLGYVVLQLVYSLALKRVALIDVMVIAIGFVLRAIAGAVVLNVDISPWLLLCTLLLALFLGLCKRRQEKVFDAVETHGHRPALARYDERLLDQLIAIVAATTVMSYSIYTLWPGTVEKFGTNALGFSIPFVIFGVFRYLDLVYRHQRGGRPEKVLLSDLPLLIDIALYGLSMILIFKWHG